ncbi:MAG: hypothetical protein QOE93_1248 [Actinomycetota bacterium]|jgi:hypothetical protein|nr:hypothetical protein [Actinomycetota bacterium]
MEGGAGRSATAWGLAVRWLPRDSCPGAAERIMSGSRPYFGSPAFPRRLIGDQTPPLGHARDFHKVGGRPWG